MIDYEIDQTLEFSEVEKIVKERLYSLYKRELNDYYDSWIFEINQNINLLISRLK